MNDLESGPNQQDAGDTQSDAHDPDREERGRRLPQSTNGTLVLILGLASWLMCSLFTAVPGWLIARADRKLIQAGRMQPDSMLEAGYWLNLLAVLITSFFILLGLLFLVFGALAGLFASLM